MNNLRIILGSKSEKFKNIEARKKFRHSFKRGVYLVQCKAERKQFEYDIALDFSSH